MSERTLRQRWHKKWAFWWDREPLWPVANATDKVGCFLFGHVPIRDQCDKPEHDYCAWCGRLMPGQGEGR